MEKIEVSNDKPKKKYSTLIFAVIAFIFSITICLVVFLGDEDNAPKEKLSITNVEIVTEYNEYLGYSAKITGIAKNITKKDFSYVSVEFAVYDASGNNLGTAIDNVNNILAGDTWRFEATLFEFPSTEPVSFKLIEVTAW